MLQRILVASDLTPESAVAVRRAVSLARTQRAHLCLLHVTDDGARARHGADSERARASLASAAADLEPAQRETVVLAGRPSRVIVAESQARRADLVVLGAHGHAGIMERFLGTTAERVFRRSPIPVLVALRPPEEPYRRAVCGVDFSAPRRAALDFVMAWLPGAELSVVHAFELEKPRTVTGLKVYPDVLKAERGKLTQALKQEIADALRRHRGAKFTLHRSVRRGDPRKILSETVRRRDAQLLAVGAHARSRLAATVLGSLALQILVDPPSDVLLVRGA